MNNNIRSKICVFAMFFAGLSFKAWSTSTIGLTGNPGDGDVANYANGLTVSLESLATSTEEYVLPLNGNTSTNGVAINRTIRFVPSFSPLEGDIFTFTLTGALFRASSLALYGEESAAGQGNIGAYDINGDGDTLDVVEVATLFSSLDAETGYDTFELRVNASVFLPTGVELLLQTGTPTDAGADGEIDDSSLLSPELYIDETNPSNVTISSTGRNIFDFPIGTASASNQLVDFESQFRFIVADPGDIVSNLVTFPGTSIIDVNSELGAEFSFDDENSDNDTTDNEIRSGDANDDTDSLSSAAFFTIENDLDSSIEDFITLDANDSFEVHITSTNGLEQLDLANSGIQLGSYNVDDTEYTFTDDSVNSRIVASVPGDALPARGASVSDKIFVSVTGTERVDPRELFTGATLTYINEDDVEISAQFSSQQSHIWETNGITLHAPYITLNPNYNNRIILTNSGSTAATYDLYVQVEDGETISISSGSESGSVPANANLVLFASDLIESTSTNRASFTFVFSASSDQLQGISQVIDPSVGIEVQNVLLRPGTN